MRVIKSFFYRWRYVFLITILVRLSLFVYSWKINDSTFGNFFIPWIRWDGPHYIEIAQKGYQTVGEGVLFIVFYPLYPLLIKLTALFIQNFQLCSILVAITFSCIASILLFELALLNYNKRLAFLSVWFLNIFPTSYFLQASYTESLFLTTSIASVYFFQKNNFYLSGFFGALSSLARVNGIILPILVLFEPKKITQKIISMSLSFLGFLFYLLINFFIYGDFFYFTKPLMNNWYKTFEWPWIGIKNLINYISSQKGDYYYLFLGELIFVILLFIASFFVFLKIRKSYGIYMFINLFLFTSTSFIMSTPRYALSLFPIFLALGFIKNKSIILLISIVFILLLFKLTEFYITGRWAY